MNRPLDTSIVEKVKIFLDGLHNLAILIHFFTIIPYREGCVIQLIIGTDCQTELFSVV